MLKLQAIGHLGRDASTNTVNGKTVINFAMAHSEKWKDQSGNQQEKTTWVDCSWWTEKTAVVPYLKKGTQVYVDGQPEVRTFDKKDGTPGHVLSVRIGQLQLLGGGQQSAPQPAQAAAPVSDQDELPF